MSRLTVIQYALAVLALFSSLGVQAQGSEGRASLSVVFANELGEGKFRAGLARSLAEQLASNQRSTTSSDREWVAVLRVRTLSEQVVAGRLPTVEAIVAVSLMDTVTGRVRLTRTVRSAYPAAADDAMERLGEVTGRRLGQSMCDVACGIPLRPYVSPPRRVIKESDW